MTQLPSVRMEHEVEFQFPVGKSHLDDELMPEWEYNPTTGFSSP